MQLCDYRETIVSVRISCDSGIAIKIFTHMNQQLLLKILIVS